MEKLSNDLRVIGEEIREYQAMESEAVFEIGMRLKHIKENDLAHGKWYEWLESVGLNQRTAQRYMQVYMRFNGVKGAQGIPISKLTELLSLPEETDVKPFIEAAKMESVRSIREKVRKVKGSETRRSSTQSEPGKQSALEARIHLLERQVRELAHERDRYKREAQQAEQRAQQAQQQSWRQLFSGGGGGVPTSKILGLSDNATPQEAKARYRQLMKLLHPDQGGDAKLFDVVRKAYNELTGKLAS